MSKLNLLFCSSFSLHAPQTWKTHYFHMVCNSPSMYLKICSIFLQRTYILCVVLLFLPCILTFPLLLSVASLAYVSIIILTVLSFLTQVLGVRIFTVSNFLIVQTSILALYFIWIIIITLILGAQMAVMEGQFPFLLSTSYVR